jgi:hypothetical protein
MESKPKADNATAAQRVEVVYRMLLQGWSHPQIVQNTSKSWGCTERQVYNYIEKARKRIDEAAAQYRAEAFSEHLMARRELRKDTTDARLKLDILKDEAQLLDLYPAKRLTVDWREKLKANGINPETLRAIITHLQGANAS